VVDALYCKIQILLLLYVTIYPITISHVSVLYVIKIPNYHKVN